MAERKSFLLRADRDLLDAVQRWADDDLRSMNGQVEFLLRRALRDAGRSVKSAAGDPAKTAEPSTASIPQQVQDRDPESPP